MSPVEDLMRSTNVVSQVAYVASTRSLCPSQSREFFRGTFPLAMAPKRVRTLSAPASSAGSRPQPVPVKRARTLSSNLQRRTPSPEESRRRQRTLPAPKLMAQRLKRVVWSPMPIHGVLVENGMTYESETSSATTSTSSGHVKGRSRVLEARKRRRRKVITTMLADGDIVPNMTYLEQVTVTKKTAQRYRKALGSFLAWASHIPRGLLAADAEVDAALVAYMDELFLQGCQPDWGETLMAGLLWKMPEFGRYGRRKLARAWRAVKGWRKKCPARSRRPHSLPL